MLFAHGDPVSLVIMLALEAIRRLADHAGPIAAALLKFAAIVLLLPAIVLVLSFLCGVVTALIVRKKRWLFVTVSAEALILHLVFCVPPALLLLEDWLPFWTWLTIGLSSLVSALAGLLNVIVLVGVVALLARLTGARKEAAAPPDVEEGACSDRERR